MSCGSWDISWLCLSLLALTSVVCGIQWQERPIDISIAKGGDARLNCSVIDRGSSFVTWTKGGETLFVNENSLSGDARYSIVGEFNLVITNVAVNDEAEYTCTVQGLGHAKASLTVLTMPGSPSISSNDTRSFYVEGDTVTLTCETTGGNPAPTIHWSKNNKLLSNSANIIENLVPRGQSSSHLVITLDRSDHQANYTCVVYNSLNQDRPLTKMITLQVQYSPQISFGQYSPLVLLQNSTATLKCIVDANPSVSSVTWRKDGVTVAHTNPTWIFNPVSVSDKGTYSCTAYNYIYSQKRETTNTTSVEVIYKPNVEVPDRYTVNESQTAIVNCNVTANPDIYRITWERNTGSILMAEGHILTISNIQRNHQGNYICTARNRLRPSGQGETIGETRKVTKILVQYKPGNAFIKPISPVLIGQQLQLTCSINQQDQGYPVPTFEWIKLDTNTIVSTSATYVIQSATLSDNGNYSCTPKNIMGQGGSSVIKVEVYEKPVFQDYPQVEETIPNNRSGYSFQCKVRGRPPPSITWYKDGQRLEDLDELYTINTSIVSATYSYLTTSQVMLQGPKRPQQMLMLEDIGNYTCTATSSADSASPPLSHTLKLLILFPPRTTSNEKVATSFGQTTELICTAEAYPIPVFTWYKDTTPITAGERYTIEPTQIITVSKATSTLRISNVQQNDLGLFNCRVQNQHGRETKTIALVTKSRPEAPNNISMISKTWESVYLRWISGFDGGESQSFHINYISIPYTAHGSWNVSVIPHQAMQFNVTRLMPFTTYEFRVYGTNTIGAGAKSEPITIRTNHLEFPLINTIPEFKVQERTLYLQVNVNDSFCVRVKVSKDSGRSWKTIVLENADCFDAKSEQLYIPEDGVDKLNISLCLLNRQDVCGSHISAEIKQQATPDLTEDQVIIIGCVCAVILIVLLVILVVVICRRRQMAKDYPNQAQASNHPQNVNGIPPAKPKRGFDNQGMDTIDSVDPRGAQRTPHGNVPGPYTQIPHNAKNSYNSNQTDRNGYSGSPGMTRPNGNVPQLDTSYDSQLEKHLFENEMNRINAANMRGDPYYDNKTGDISFNGTPRKDPQQFIDLPEGHKGDFGPESGYSTAETHKPKKVIYEVVV